MTGLLSAPDPVALRRVPERALLVQLAHALNDRNVFFCNKQNVPLAAGYMRAVARARRLTDAVSVSILEPELCDFAGDAALAEAVAELRPDVLGLSLYPWNYTRSLRLVSTLRGLLPGLLVVAGGSEVNEATLPELVANGQVDVAVPGEGEMAFSDLLETLLERGDLAKVPGLVFRQNGSLIRTPARPTLVDLDEIPSPYLEGDIDPGHYRQVHVLLERGCPFSCKFCHWWPERASRGGFSLGRVEQELLLLRERGLKEVIFLDAALNASDRFDGLCDVLERVNGDGRLEIKVQLLFDRLERHQLERLAAGGVRRLELGLQSANPETLRRINRPPELDLFQRALELSDGLPLDLQVDFMMGLPGETVSSIEATARLIGQWAERHSVAQVSAFVLSVGSPTHLRAEAESLGLHYQPEPPYRVLGIEQLDYRTLRELRTRVPELLGAEGHPVFDFDRPHYALNLFEPELATCSSADPAAREPDPGRSVPEPQGLLDSIRIQCHRCQPGHAHPLGMEELAGRLTQQAQVWFQVAEPAACLDHLVTSLQTLSEPNPYTVWDVVLEVDRAFDLEIMESLLRAIHYRVHNLDWDCYFVSQGETPGYFRVATRPFLVIPPDAAERAWLEQAASRYPLLYAVSIGPGREVKALFEELGSLPGEGVVLEVAADTEPSRISEACAALMVLERRVRACRNLALKALVAFQQANRAGRPRPRIPFRDSTLLVAAPDGTSSSQRLTARNTLLDVTQLGWRLAGPG